MSKQARINIKTAVNNKTIRRERRDGRDVIIVPSATLPDGVVMNRVRYSAEAISKGFGSLEGTPAPLGHPSLNGQFVSASDPRGMVRGFVGAWNENVRRENGRVFIEKVIDVAYASQLDGGRAVIAAIDKGEAIHTSTGLYARMTPLENDASADFDATDLVFDHDAILIGEDGAATPDQGVGMLVNKAVDLEGNETVFINSTMSDEVDRELNWAVESLARALDRQEKIGVLERMKTAILEAIGLGREPNINKLENEMADENQVKDLSERVNALSEKVNGIGAVIADAVTNAVKPLVEAQTAMVNAAKAKDDAELTELRAKIVKANVMDEASAGELTLNAARALAPKTIPGKATAINGAPAKTETGGFKLPKAEA